MKIKPIYILCLAIIVSSCKKQQSIVKQPTAICNELIKLSSNYDFISRFLVLYEESVDNNFESGWLMYPSNLAHRYEKIVGKPDKPFISFELSSALSGCLHSHYKGLYPTFSGSDIRAVYQFAINDQIYDLNSFFSGLITTAGTVYLMSIKDKTAFINFGGEQFSQNSNFKKFEEVYRERQQYYYSINKDINLSFELAILDMLEGAGLSIYKGNNDLNNWQLMKKDVTGSLQLEPCN